ncbi:Asp-tRNA(Asn)/Glu-tRNA(Gln) amidotransferase subunit GatB [Candidatus Parcubacteria bacterium]|nr:Asp-tRNA(Asn)/Glu-tRNA(Gln) amidotransferase subunit GatB [Candidatus Parcubacteria bacterium]
MKYDIIIGLEIHAGLKTKRKMFCACDNDPAGKKPNENTCPICLGHPGTLPAPNYKAIEWALLLGLALKGKINKLSKFDRKNYFYPDLPKGYQISQYDLPFVYDASLKVNGRDIDITRVHLEEDTGKNTHPVGKNYSLIDFNRAGTPLLELVTEPIIESAEEAKKFCQTYQQILRYLDISNADMEKGEMRCEANVSVQEKDEWEYKDGEIRALGDYKLNPKIEVKNINSFKAVEKAINYEIKRQINAIENNEKLIQETRGWNDKKNITVSQRVKETSADYRYFPEPDIPPIKIDASWLKEIKTNIIELPPKKKERFIKQYNLSEEAAAILVSDKYLADYTEKVISELRAWIDSNGDKWERQKRKLARAAGNWLISELFTHLNKDNLSIKDIKITPENFAELIALVYQGKINSSAGTKILAQMYKNGGDPGNIMQDMGLEQIDDEAELEKTIKQVIADNPKQAEEYKNGKKTVLKFFIGQTMSSTKGKANPILVSKIIKKLF